MQTSQVKTLALVVSLFFFTSNLSGSFLPIYFKDLGLRVAEIVEILLFTFVMIGLLPVALLRIVRNFESIMSIGIFTTMVFFLILIYVKNPIILGLAQGIRSIDQKLNTLYKSDKPENPKPVHAYFIPKAKMVTDFLKLYHPATAKYFAR